MREVIAGKALDGANLDAGRIKGNEQAGDAIELRAFEVGSHHAVDAGTHVCERDPDLLAVDDVIITVAFGLALKIRKIDSDAGLSSILRTLREYDITATFFVSGEFIRRHPGAVRDLASSGHEIASLFFAHFNMTDSRFRIDRGLKPQTG